MEEMIKTNYTKEMGARYLERLAFKNAERRSSRYINKDLERPNEVRAFMEVTGMEYVDVDYNMYLRQDPNTNDIFFALDQKDGTRYILSLTNGTMSKVMVRRH